MSDADDRLAGDLVWELFPVRSTATRSRRLFNASATSLLVVLTWFISQPVSVAIACLSISIKDFRDGRRLARSIPDKAGGTICALFTYSWGAWKLSVAAFTAFAVLATTSIVLLKEQDPPPGCFFAFLLFPLGFLTSTAFTAAGLFRAIRSGMRVWIGEGVNQARTLMLASLIVVFTLCVLVPWTLVMVAGSTGAGKGQALSPLAFIAFLGFLVSAGVGPIIILTTLDRIGRRVLAEQPGKFGAKSSMVGKWEG